MIGIAAADSGEASRRGEGVDADDLGLARLDGLSRAVLLSTSARFM